MKVVTHKADGLIESRQASGWIMHARTDSLGLTSALLLWLTSFSAAAATNDFQNLGFESASLISIAGDPYNRVEASAALPGWKV